MRPLSSLPREGKRLLVLDLDYCILDTKLWREENFVAERASAKLFSSVSVTFYEDLGQMQTFADRICTSS